MILEKDFEEFLKNRLDEQTYKNYYYILEKLFKETNLTVEKIKNSDSNELAKILTNFIEKKWTRLFAVKNLLIFYHREDVLNLLPTPKTIKRGRRILKKSIPFSVIKKVVEKANDEIKLLIMLQYETGARISEILAITKDDVDLENKQITVGGLKGSESRTIKLTNKTFELLKKHLPKPFQKTYHYYLKKMKEVFQKENVSTHWLRFSRAVHLFNKGYDVMTIKRLLGHKSLESTHAYLKEAGIELKDLLEKEAPEW
jgi:integrase